MGAGYRQPGEDMAGKSKKDPLATLMALPGVGKATAKKLSDSGIKTPAGIVKAGPKGLIKAGISAAISKKLLSVVSKKATSKKTAAKKPAAKKSAVKKVVGKAKSTAKKAAAKKATGKAKSTAKKAVTKAKAKAKNAASKATAAGRKVAEKTAKGTGGSNTIPSSKSTDGRKGTTLKVPRTVKDMPWFRKK